MPVVKKLVPGQMTPDNHKTLAVSPFDRIVNVKDVKSRGIKMCVFGDGKTGKSRLMCTFPKPLLIVGAEDGTETVRNVPGVSFIQVVLRNVWQRSVSPASTDNDHVVFLDELPEFFCDLAKSKFATIAVDTATSLQDLILADVLGLDRPPEQKSWGLAGQEEWGLVANRFKTMLGWMFDSTKHVIVTAQEKDFSKKGEKENLGVPAVGGALTGSSWLWLRAKADYVCQTFKQGRTVKSMMTMPDGSEVESLTPAKGADFCLRIAPNGTHQVGFRNVGDGNDLPDFLVDPSFDKIVQVIKGEWKK